MVFNINIISDQGVWNGKRAKLFMCTVLYNEYYTFLMTCINKVNRKLHIKMCDVSVPFSRWVEKKIKKKKNKHSRSWSAPVHWRRRYPPVHPHLIFFLYRNYLHTQFRRYLPLHVLFSMPLIALYSSVCVKLGNRFCKEPGLLILHIHMQGCRHLVPFSVGPSGLWTPLPHQWWTILKVQSQFLP